MSRYPESSDRSRLPAVSLAAVLALGIFVGIGLTTGLKGSSVKAAAGGPTLPGAESPFVKVAEQILPGVVSVEAKQLFRHPPVEADTSDEMAVPGGPGGGGIVLPTSGSGFIFDREGHILTNNHVVAHGAEISVQLADGRRLPAQVVGTDPQTDVAVLKVESPDPLPVVNLGDSDALKIGEWVAAVGNPLGMLEGTLTVGVVSAKKRSDIEISGSSPSYQDFIQTDAAINFGNSGGPLVNTRGEAVGMNTAFGGPGKGIGFAISINMAKEVARSLIEDGRVKRGYLGVVLQPLDPALARGLGLPDAKGVLLRDVTPGLPAEQAGLRAGDVIRSFDGLDVGSMSDFRLQVARTRVGTDASIRYIRQGRNGQARVRLVERPDMELAGNAGPKLPPQPTEIGLELSAPPPGAELGEGEPAHGILVSKIRDEGIAAAAGLELGDVILDVDGRSPETPEGCMSELLHDQTRSVPAVLHMQRGNDRWYVALPFGMAPTDLESGER